MASKVIPPPNILYRYPKPTVLDQAIFRDLPEPYIKFFKEWRLTTPSPVHYIPKEEKWERDPKTGEVRKVQNVPLPLMYPKEIHQGIWGGETIVLGYQKRQPLKRRVPHFWIPRLRKSVVYSEILNQRMSTIVTSRTIDLILENHGFDHYILETPACDLYSLLALKLKRKMLFALMDKSLYPNDVVKQEEVYNKYKHYLEPYTREYLEWYGLSLTEAKNKVEALEEAKKTEPFKHKYRLELIAQLVEDGLLKQQSGGELEEQQETFVAFNEETGVNVTAKSNPTMLLVKVNIESGDVVSFSHPNQAKLYVTVPQSDSEKRTCLMWLNETVEATDCGSEAAVWFSQLLSGKECGYRLGYFIPSPDKPRSVETAPFNKYAEVFKEMRSEYMGAFSYLSSYLLLSSSSLSDLNVRVNQPVSAYNFRPNIVVERSVPYEEDSWNWIKIGKDVILKNFKPCTRCYITTLDPETALPASNHEPIRTLKKYRQLNDQREIEVEGLCPTFGIYIGLHKGGTVAVGEPVYVNVE